MLHSSRYRENWRRLLFPRSVALIGASDSNISSKYVYENMIRGGFASDIHPINPRRSQVFGIPAYPTIGDSPGADVAIILVGRERVEDAVLQAMQAGVGGIIVVTGGFRETNEADWIAAESRMALAAKAAEIPLIGPNCLGVMSVPTGAIMTLANYPWPIERGSIALVMQSGGQLLASCRYVNVLGGGLRWGFSVGNATTVSFAEVLSAIADDADTSEIVLLIEEIGDWERFRDAVTLARNMGKWIAAVVIGRTEKGQRAAATHTGAVAVDHEIITAGLAQLGIRVGETLNATLGAAVLHSRFGNPLPGGVGIAGVSGGASGLSADLAAARGVRLAKLSPTTEAAIRRANPEVLPDNPIDIVGGPLDTPRFRAVFEAFLRDPDVGAALYLPSQGVPEDTLPGHVAVAEGAADAAEAVGVPVVFSAIVYAPIPEEPHRRLLERRNVCVLPTIEEAFASLTIWRLEPLQLLELNRRRYQPFGKSGRADESEAPIEVQPLHEASLKAILAVGGCSVPEGCTLSPADAPHFVAERKRIRISYPLVLKGVSRSVFHKADLGLVRLDISNRRKLVKEIGALLAAPAADDVEILLIEEQLPPGIDLIVSILASRLGTVVVIGEGGAGAGRTGTANWLAIAPDEAELVGGARHILGKFGGEVHAQAVADLTRRLVATHARYRFQLLEINPARILPSGTVFCLDVVATAPTDETATCPQEEEIE